MKKVFSLLAVSILLVTGCSSQEQQKNSFYLDKEMYENGTFINIEALDLEEMIEQKKSFALFIYQPLCTTSSNFEEILTKYIQENNVTIYKIPFSEIKNTSLSKKIKYYPSFAIYEKGKVVDYLDAKSDEDLNVYKTSNGFNNWFTEYVKIKKVENENNTSKNETKEDNEIIELNLPNVKYDENKVNIYFFWGDGCPHCEGQFDFLDSIKEEYGKYFNLYTFEVWYNEENEKILQTFSKLMGDEIKGIPYTVIGKKTFKGFAESTKDDMIEAILSQYKNSYDVYFDNK